MNATVRVEFVGGPLEGVTREFTAKDLRQRYYHAVAPRLPVLDLAEIHNTPREVPFKKAEYVLHRFSDRYEYVHDGTH